jgi:hypothetical protein
MIGQIEPVGPAQVEPDQPAREQRIEKRGVTSQVDACTSYQHWPPPPHGATCKKATTTFEIVMNFDGKLCVFG